MPQYYSKQIISHFLHPKNLGKIKDAEGVGDTQNLKCGDIMKVYLKIEKKGGKEIIKDAKFETMGCGHAIAISDIICDLIKGKTLDEAVKIGYQHMVADLGEVPPQKIHCAHLAQEGVKMAVADYRKKQKK
jgi:nitrogen fixation NifU-like protein